MQHSLQFYGIDVVTLKGFSDTEYSFSKSVNNLKGLSHSKICDKKPTRSTVVCSLYDEKFL